MFAGIYLPHQPHLKSLYASTWPVPLELLLVRARSIFIPSWSVKLREMHENSLFQACWNLIALIWYTSSERPGTTSFDRAYKAAWNLPVAPLGFFIYSSYVYIDLYKLRMPCKRGDSWSDNTIMLRVSGKIWSPWGVIFVCVNTSPTYHLFIYICYILYSAYYAQTSSDPGIWVDVWQKNIVTDSERTQEWTIIDHMLLVNKTWRHFSLTQWSWKNVLFKSTVGEEVFYYIANSSDTQLRENEYLRPANLF